MSTVGQLVDRCFRELLTPADDAPTRTTLAAAVDADDLTWTYDGTALAADEEELFAPGVVVEVGLEQALVVAADHASDTLTVRRGVNGTTAAVHSLGDELTPAPAFGRRAVFDAVCDNVVVLWPALYHVATETLVVTTGYTEVPATVVTPIHAATVVGGRHRGVGWVFIDNFPPSATTKAITVSGASVGSTVYFTYRGKFARPTSEADNLQTLGVAVEWERIVMVGAAVHMLAGRELDSANVEFITEQMRSEGYPVGSAQRQRDGLIRYHQFLLDQARRTLLASNAEVVTMTAAV